jgi:hypothetical protein
MIALRMRGCGIFNQEADMRSTFFAVPLAILTIAGMLAGQASAQETKKARGKITGMTGTQITVDVAGKATNFAVDDKTKLEASGAGTAARRAEAAGKSGVKLGDFVKTGDAVEVSYHETGMHAATIRKVSSVGSASSATSTTEDTKSSNGKVTAVTPTSLSISGSTGAAQTFVIDAKTKVVGKGAGTAAAKAGGKVVATDVVHSGDTVHVSFHDMAGTLHAATITVTMKAAAK